MPRLGLLIGDKACPGAVLVDPAGVANERVKIQKVLGRDNTADALTRFLPDSDLERHMAQM